MKIFIDTANIDEVIEANNLGVIDGVTTNPSLIAKSGMDIREVISEICTIIKGDVSAEVYSEEFEEIIVEGQAILDIAKNVVLKLPLTEDGLKACKYFSMKGFKTNVTLCFSAGQALLAAKAGASYISPFIGRLDDISQNGIDLIRDIKQIYSNYPEYKTEILAASIRSVSHIIESAKIGADAATMPFKTIKELYKHELTDKGLEIFRNETR